VEMTFESMDDFSPGRVAEHVDELKELLDARRELSNLLSYMDGKSGAENLLGKVLGDKAALEALAGDASSGGA